MTNSTPLRPSSCGPVRAQSPEGAPTRHEAHPGTTACSGRQCPGCTRQHAVPTLAPEQPCNLDDGRRLLKSVTRGNVEGWGG
eukprot:364730-Chlamydomonas_euryale.AAC.10